MKPLDTRWQNEDKKISTLLELHDTPPPSRHKVSSMSSSSYTPTPPVGGRSSSQGREYRSSRHQHHNDEYRQVLVRNVDDMRQSSSSGRPSPSRQQSDYRRTTDYPQISHSYHKDYRPVPPRTDMVDLELTRQQLLRPNGRESSLRRPPSYASSHRDVHRLLNHSLSWRIKRAYEKSEDKGTFVKSCVTILCTSFLVIIPLGLASSLPLAMFIIGIMNKDQCPAERFLPIYLISAGAVGICLTLLPFIVMICLLIMVKFECGPMYSNDPRATPLTTFITKLCYFSFVFTTLGTAIFVAGNVWIYRIKGRFDAEDPDSAKYCDLTTYDLAFWVLTSCYIVGCFAACILFTICGFAIRRANKNDKAHRKQEDHMEESTV